ncbi:MAG: cell division protein ZapE [Burkholderiales bacterium]|jgi:cell division protein ZapE|nr:cell division protein ZapE [Burkholderiales bacterium]
MKLLQNWYLLQTKQNYLVYDEYQHAILQQLDIFITNFSARGFFANLWRRPNNLGVYLYGSVGSGKSMLLDELFRQIPETQKTRTHFHKFMSDIHQKLADLKDQNDPLDNVARELRRKYRIIFLDEMHVNDIATAMILKNLLSGLFKHGVYIVTSSNFAPNQLYPDGLMRERFLGAIELIGQKLQILKLENSRDYRLQHNTHNQFFIINNRHSHDKLTYLFNKFAADNQVIVDNEIIIQGRPIWYVKKSAHIIWFKFDIICGENRSHLDYLDLCNKFDYIVIEDIEPINSKDIARRLTWLVDILYDNRRKVILSASCGIGQIYVAHTREDNEFAIEFSRTVSRLIEMQTQEYLTQQSLESIAL